MTSRITRRFTISGRVQGVGYRYFAQRAAQELGLDGWVRNRSDGSVECSATGPTRDLDAFEHSLRQGPPRAIVTSVETRETDAPAHAKSGFEIR
jgi:acylphosphatase